MTKQGAGLSGLCSPKAESEREVDLSSVVVGAVQLRELVEKWYRDEMKKKISIVPVNDDPICHQAAFVNAVIVADAGTGISGSGSIGEWHPLSLTGHRQRSGHDGEGEYHWPQGKQSQRVACAGT